VQSVSRVAVSIVTNRITKLNHADARLHALSPLAVLNRGYALVYSADGELLRNSADVRAGDSIRARLALGSIEAEVTRTEPSPTLTENH
jgi:exodeoxyribonuclease VII large subunit